VSLGKGATIVAAITVMVATVAVAMTVLGEIEWIVDSRSTDCE